MNILFLCKGNSCRSQMAEGFAKRYLRGHNVFSAGFAPEGYVHPMSVRVMRERGIDISNQRSKGLDALPPLRWDVVVLVCSAHECPTYEGATVEVWDIPDPFGGDLKAYRRVRDLIEERVKLLARRLSTT
ncbi:MAG: arsenate reductase ArsC [Thermotogae bacterium]|nr:arsenate reductase ArsC [Thermotogota bacterium]